MSLRSGSGRCIGTYPFPKGIVSGFDWFALIAYGWDHAFGSDIMVGFLCFPENCMEELDMGWQCKLNLMLIKERIWVLLIV